MLRDHPQHPLEIAQVLDGMPKGDRIVGTQGALNRFDGRCTNGFYFGLLPHIAARELVHFYDLDLKSVLSGQIAEGAVATAHLQEFASAHKSLDEGEARPHRLRLLFKFAE